MTALFVIWAIGTIACLLGGTLVWTVSDPNDPYDTEIRRKAARAFLLAPVWPVLVVSPLKQIIRDALTTEGE